MLCLIVQLSGEKHVVNGRSNELPFKFAVNVKERQDKLSTMYWLPKLNRGARWPGG